MIDTEYDRMRKRDSEHGKKQFNMHTPILTSEATKSQRISFNRVIKAMASHDLTAPYRLPNGNDFKGTEIKEIDVSLDKRSGLLFVYIVTGIPDDEGTFASIYCRDYRNFYIGPRGGIYTAINTKRKRKNGVHWDSMNLSDFIIHGRSSSIC